MKSNPKELALWLQKGNEDLDVARLIQQKKKAYWAACFHAQQAAEKFLKAAEEIKKFVFDKIG